MERAKDITIMDRLKDIIAIMGRLRESWHN
jgi:hypothetical protein